MARLSSLENPAIAAEIAAAASAAAAAAAAAAGPTPAVGRPTPHGHGEQQQQQGGQGSSIGGAQPSGGAEAARAILDAANV